MTPRTVNFVTLVVLLGTISPAAADRPYVVVRDDGTVQTTRPATVGDLATINDFVLAEYGATGAPLPEILSVWTTFPIGGDSYGTYFDPVASEVTGIGLENEWPTPWDSPTPPLASILLHNDVTRMAARAALAGAPVDGYASYLFLLELTHTFGPAIRVPGPKPGELQGFPVHWSFFLDAGGSPAGGNLWLDQGDGTFATRPQTPAGMRYSLLDLYLLGLVAPTDVPPFGVLENPALQGDSAQVVDPMWGGPLAAHSFPWFGSTPIVVKATRRALTIDDVVAKNGARSPAFPVAQKSWKLGIVLVVAKTTTDQRLAQLTATFDPIAAQLAPAFATATGGRGSLEVVTPGPQLSPDGGVDAAAPPPDASVAAPSTDSGGCALGGGNRPGSAGWLLALLIVARAARRRRAPAV